MKFSKLKEKFTKVINSEGECSNKLFRNSFSNCVSTESRLLKKTRTSDFQASRAESAKFKS